MWAALHTLEGLPRESPDYAKLRSQLLQASARRESAARQRGDRALALRARVLGAHLARLDGLEVRRVRDPGIVLEFLPGEAWLCAEACMSGPLRTRAVIATLDEARGDDLATRSDFAEQVILEDLHDLRIDLAEALGRAWSAHCETVEHSVLLARILRSAGRLAEAQDVLGSLAVRALDIAERRLYAEESARLASARDLVFQQMSFNLLRRHRRETNHLAA